MEVNCSPGLYCECAESGGVGGFGNGVVSAEVGFRV